MRKRQKTSATNMASSQQEDVANVNPASCMLPEMLEQIFKYLDITDKRRAALVCLAWRDANYKASVWKGVGILWTNLINVADNPTLVPSLAKRGILRASMSSSAVLEDLATDFPIVQSLQLNFGAPLFEPIETATTLGTLQNLTELDLRRRYHLRDRHVKIIAESLGGLKVLNLSNATCLTDLAVCAISLGLKQLRQLYLGWCHLITDKGVSYLTACNPDLDTSPVTRLNFLVMSHCSNLTDQAMSYLSTGQSRLKYLDVGHTRITNASLEHLSKIHTMTELRLSGCRYISDLGMAYVSRMYSLRQLDLSCGSVGDAGLHLLTTGLSASGITGIDLQLCHRLSDEGLEALVKLRNLRKLDLTRCLITDAGLKNLAQIDSRVAFLYLRSCENVTDVGLCHLDKMTRLTDLSVSYCNKVTHRGFVTLAESGSRITTIDVSECARIDISSLEQISRSLPQLKFLYNTLGLIGRRPH